MDRDYFLPIWVMGFSAVLSFASPSAVARRSHAQKIFDQAAKTAASSLVAAPKDGEVCFSPEEACDAKLVKFVHSAQLSLDIAIFDVTLDSFVHELIVRARQLPVRVLVDRRQAKGEHSLVKTLLEGGVEVRFGHQRGIMHNKFVLVDAKRVETGSFNFTTNATANNNENQVYLADPSIVERYRARFERIWRESSVPKLTR